MNFIRILVLLFCLTFSACTPKMGHNKITVVEAKVLSTLEELKSGKSSCPLYLGFRTLELQEIASHLNMDLETTKAHLRATNIHGYYSLSAKNYPPGVEFTLYQVDLSKNVYPLKSFFVTLNGNLVTPLDDLQVTLENNFLFFSNYLPGEPADFVLGSKNGQYFAAASIVPNPLITSDGIRTLSVQLEHADRRHYLIHGTGLIPLSCYTLITTFENEKFAHTVTANERGEIFQKAGPTVPWVKGGDASIELRGGELAAPQLLNFRFGF